jgi:macrolide transport system ATP-binding/permease protein
MIRFRDVPQDLAYAIRVMSRNPGFTLTAILTIALGIGVNTTLFSIFNAVALKPLPVAEPNEVVRMKRWFETGSQGDIQYSFSYPEFIHVRDRNETFSSVVASSSIIPVMATLAAASGVRTPEAERVQVQLASANYFTALGIDAQFGRTFQVDEDRVDGGSPVLVVSHAFWQQRFNGDRNVLGRTVVINDTVFTVRGVTPDMFTGTDLLPQPPDFWAPVSMQASLVPGQDWLRDPEQAEFQILARLKPSISRGNAEAHADTLLRQFTATFKERQKTASITLERPALFGNVDDPGFQLLAVALMFAVGLVLIVACANVSNMLIAQGTTRQREVSIRYALGAGRGRIVRQFMTENVLLAFAGGLGGLVLSVWLAQILWTTIKDAFAGSPFDTLTLDINLTPDLRVFGYALGLSLVAVAAFGILPALQATNLKTFRRFRWRSTLLASQVLVSMIFLIGAGLLGRGLLHSQDVNVGYETRDVFLLKADFGNDTAQARRTQQRLHDELINLREVKSATFGTPPLFGTATPTIIVNGRRDRTLTSMASDTYFDTMGIPVVRGRNFTRSEADAVTRANVAIVSESTARRFWPGQDPIQQHLQLVFPFQADSTDFEVVGVVRDVRFANPTRLDPVHVYLPTSVGPSSLVVRVQGDRPMALSALRKGVERVDANLVASLELINLEQGPLWAHKTMPRAMAMFVGILGTIAVLLAGIGIYGVISYIVNQRLKEIGIRVALGANREAVLKTVVLRGLKPAIAGIVVGIVSALVLSWMLHQRVAHPGASDFLQGVRFYDPVTFLGLSLFVATVAIVASAVPAWRALKVDPALALRHE